MNKHAVPGEVDPNRFKNAKYKYELNKELKQVKVGDETFGQLLDKKYKGKASKQLRFSVFHNHHNYDIADNFWDTDVVFFKDNMELRKFEKGARESLKRAANLPEGERAAYLKSFADDFKKLGPIRMTEGPVTIGAYDFKEMVKTTGKKVGIPDVYKAYRANGIGKGCPIGKAEGGRIGFNTAGVVGYDQCMNNAIKEHNKNLKSDDLVVRNDARAKQFNINKTKNMKSLLGAGAKGGKSLLKLGRSWGIELEPIFEGAFYEWGRRQGYTHDQAKEETFFWKMLDPSTKTGLLEGAEPLLEKELYEIRGEDEFMDVDNRPPMQDPEFGQVIGERGTVKRYIENEKALYEAQDKYNQLYTGYQVATTGKERDPEKAEGYAKALEDTWAEINRLEDQLDLDRDMYQAAVEKQQHIQGERALKYGEYGTGDTEKLAKQRERRRQREMEDKFPGLSKWEIDKRLESAGLAIDPNLLKYKKVDKTKYPWLEDSGENLQELKEVPYYFSKEKKVPATYESLDDFFKNREKMKYFAENYRLEKAGGGRVPFGKGALVDKGRRADWDDYLPDIDDID